jgi:dTDP-4-dehydrorhamnose 3,5-epimerase-like enzyme
MRNHPTFEDFRGSFTPIKLNVKPDGVEKWDQVNLSINSKKGTFRGMHYQSKIPQQKYIKVVSGSIIDYLYHLKTKQVMFFELDKNKEIFVSKEYAHGFLTLEDNTIVTYLAEGKYDPEFEHSISYKDIPIIRESILSHFSEKDIIINEKDSSGK